MCLNCFDCFYGYVIFPPRKPVGLVNIFKSARQTLASAVGVNRTYSAQSEPPRVEKSKYIYKPDTP